jgi:hypothetical protein
MVGIYIPATGVELTFESRPGDLDLRLTLMAAYNNWTINLNPTMTKPADARKDLECRY